MSYQNKVNNLLSNLAREETSGMYGGNCCCMLPREDYYDIKALDMKDMEDMEDMEGKGGKLKKGFKCVDYENVVNKKGKTVKKCKRAVNKKEIIQKMLDDPSALYETFDYVKALPGYKKPRVKKVKEGPRKPTKKELREALKNAEQLKELQKQAELEAFYRNVGSGLKDVGYRCFGKKENKKCFPESYINTYLDTYAIPYEEAVEMKAPRAKKVKEGPRKPTKKELREALKNAEKLKELQKQAELEAFYKMVGEGMRRRMY